MIYWPMPSLPQGSTVAFSYCENEVQRNWKPNVLILSDVWELHKLIETEIWKGRGPRIGKVWGVCKNLTFLQLKKYNLTKPIESEIIWTLSVNEYFMKNVSGGPQSDKHDPLQSKLNKVEQLTGFSDPVYAEAYVNVNQYDIVLDVLVVNQTGDTLQVSQYIWKITLCYIYTGFNSTMF